MPFNIGSLFNGLSTAITGGNVSGAISAIGTIQSALGTSQATLSKAQMYLQNYQLAQAIGDKAGMSAAANGLIAMTDALPAADAPLVNQLSNPAIQASPATAAGVISQIQASLLQHSFSI